ncbi:DUF3099 domain-containing protein [Streptomyces pacificus]|uniref:DUF3099 domain-containing protein n=1 Tax=Streptomyces pacificus TaxID=2705029 RepID=A0A6A0ASP3_9ACTN|nr:DUF3099 domain-containing protein [Streptomyces pacificus]GFH35333.1 DUF3099 domain-containing protein [Streptomyces pacificus]
MRDNKETEVFRITGARQGLADDVRGRQRRYVISMSVRTLAVILAAVLWNVERHVAIVALVLGAALPYIAVVIANAGRESAPKPLATFVPASTRPVLESGSPEPRRAPADEAENSAAEKAATEEAAAEEAGRAAPGARGAAPYPGHPVRSPAEGDADRRAKAAPEPEYRRG